MNEETQLSVIPENQLTSAQFAQQHKQLVRFVKSQLKEAQGYKENGYDKLKPGDYGIIPRTSKKSLLKPGAEKLLKLFGFVAKMELVKEIEEFEKGFVLYKYRCTITHAATGTFIADAVRSCNNKEPKHASKSVFDAANTIESVAQKRALVAATVQATMASEIFDADIAEDQDSVHEEEAPNRTVSKEEDPRRNKLLTRLWATASDHGWSDTFLHAALMKKWGIDSITKLSNEQIVEVTEGIMEKWEQVGKGNPPRMKGSIYSPEVKASDPIEGEVISTEATYYCRGPKHQGKPPETTISNPWCSEECKNDYYPEKKDPRKDFKFT